MSARSIPIISREDLSKEQAGVVATLATSKATETARRDAAKTLHSLMLAADPRASTTELMHTAAHLADAMKAEDPTLRSGVAYVGMRAHLMRTGDLKPTRSQKRASASPSPASDPTPAQVQALIATSKPKKRRGILGWLFGR